MHSVIANMTFCVDNWLYSPDVDVGQLRSPCSSFILYQLYFADWDLKIVQVTEFNLRLKCTLHVNGTFTQTLYMCVYDFEVWTCLHCAYMYSITF